MSKTENENTTQDKLDSEALSRELESAFRAERALLNSGMEDRVMSSLRGEVSLLTSAARAVSAVFVLALVCVVGAAAAFIVIRSGVWTPVYTLKMVVLLVASVVAALLALAAPRLAIWDAHLISAISGRRVSPGAADLLIVKLGAVLILVLGGMVLF